MRREEVLAKKTHKQDGVDVARRVFYTLKGEEPEDWQTRAHRNSKAIAMLIKNLSELGILTEDRIDDILLEVVS
jgi:ABC-type uncharacterized transport system substrate-binding protein